MTAEKTVQLVVCLVAVCALGGIIATTVLIYEGKDADSVAGFATTALGALAAMLVSTRSTPPTPPEDNPPG